LLKEQHDAKVVKDVGIGVGIASFGIGGTYVAYKIGKALYGWGEDIVDYVKGNYEALDDSNILSKTSIGPSKYLWMILGL